MASKMRRQMCLSSENHDNRVLDDTLHFFGCLRLSARDRFYNRLPEKSRRKILRERDRIERTRERLECEPESKAGKLLKEFKGSINDWRQATGRSSVELKRTPIIPLLPEDSIEDEIKASIIFFRDSRPYDIPGVQNTFPNQKIPISRLLAEDKDSNPLMQPCEGNMIRYFHLPANNMIWVEEAIARYYHEKRPEAEDLFVKSKLRRKRTKTEMLLAPEFWQGQQNFEDNSEVHGRHMRPLCDVISINPVSSEPLPKNLVLFMPYLHWETDRGREQTAKAIKEANPAKLSSVAEIVSQAKAANEQNPETGQNSGDKIDCNKPQAIACLGSATPLGKVLFLAAALMEAIDFRTEGKLIDKYLHDKPPLHPRRTLDQSYYGTLKDTKTRDRDQVVYRATAPVAHHDPNSDDGMASREKCEQCQEDIRKVSRLIMVDQLWLWILDGNTVITSFPRRWGKNRPDPSAVHKSLRLRLKAARKDEIRSAYDLALIVIDECSRVFFDRTKNTERQPKLIDNFVDAIGEIKYKQTAAFDQFLIYTHLATREYNSRDKTGSDSTQNTLLNISLEGNLLKEIKDIVDEIHILTRVKLQQQIVAETFVKYIKQSLLPQLRSRPARHPIISLYEDEDDTEAESLQRDQREAAKWTLTRADHLLNDVQERIGELRMLEENARKTEVALKDVLALKVQQAGVIEAREAVKQATETLNQGKSIMLFTVVTIVFLPLSFLAAVFGMNAQEFNGGTLSLAQEFTYMFPISVGVIAISFLLAFGRNTILSSFFCLLGTIISFPFNMALTWFIAKSGLYTLSRKVITKSNMLKDKENKKTAMMKAKAMSKEPVLPEMERIYKKPPQERDEGFLSPRVGTMSRLGTPRLGSDFDEDVEMGRINSSRSHTRLISRTP